VLSVVFNVTDVLISLTVIGTAEDAAMGITWRELLAEIVVGVLIHFLISITAVIAVVVPTTMTTSMSIITVATTMTTITTVTATTTITAATAALRVDWGGPLCELDGCWQLGCFETQ
jgi:hypothetical protein